MTLAFIGGGSQIGDGNLSEVKLGTQGDVAMATATATLTTAQVLAGILVGNPSTTAATYTMPTGAELETALSNVKTGSTFDLTVINLGTSTGLITMAVSTGVTFVGNLVVAITGSAAGVGGAAQFRFRRTAANTFVGYRIV